LVNCVACGDNCSSLSPTHWHLSISSWHGVMSYDNGVMWHMKYRSDWSKAVGILWCWRKAIIELNSNKIILIYSGTSQYGHLSYHKLSGHFCWSQKHKLCTKSPLI
jgi:hypothetical protein